MHPAPPFTYVLPIRSGEPLVDDEFSAYLAWVADRAELIVVDASPPGVFAEHARRWGGHGLHVAPRLSTPMGKVGNVLTGLSLAANDRVVIADDDIRYGPELEELVRRLDGAEVVRPQNWFDPLPWHAVWDSGRILISRVWGGDWPGTLAVRSSRVTPAGGYAGDVMFENYELVRTVEAAGGRSAVAADIFVRRRPPTGRHFWSQRVRQAYDELARPARLAVFAPLVPGVAVLAGGRRWRALGRLVAAVSLAAAGAAEWGRRRDGAAAGSRCAARWSPRYGCGSGRCACRRHCTPGLGAESCTGAGVSVTPPSPTGNGVGGWPHAGGPAAASAPA